MDHRLTDRLLNYWESLRGSASLPDYSSLNTSTIEDVWQQCIVFTIQPSVEGKPRVANFTMVGDKIRPMYSSDMVGRSFTTSQRHFQAAAIVRKMEEVITQPCPMVDVGQFISESGRVVKYRSCLMPFGRDSKVTHVVVGISWREYL